MHVCGLVDGLGLMILFHSWMCVRTNDKNCGLTILIWALKGNIHAVATCALVRMCMMFGMRSSDRQRGCTDIEILRITLESVCDVMGLSKSGDNRSSLFFSWFIQLIVHFLRPRHCSSPEIVLSSFHWSLAWYSNSNIERLASLVWETDGKSVW